MTDRPIIFSAPMVRALLAGTKTQTRRAIKPQPARRANFVRLDGAEAFFCDGDHPRHHSCEEHEHPLRLKAAIGDRLYVRETFSGPYELLAAPPRDWPVGSPIWFWADGSPAEGDWTTPRVGMFLPRWASRLTLTVTDVRVQRLNDATDADAFAEGVIYHAARGFVVPGVEHTNKDFPYLARPTAREMFAALWDTINGSGAWAANPWIAAYTFTVERANVDHARNAT